MAEEDQEDQEQPLPAAVAVEAAQEKPNQLVSEADDDTEITKGSSLSLKLKIPITNPPAAAAAEADDHQFMEEDLLLQQEQEQDQQDRSGVLGLPRTCSECGKQFTSGKALGGHKRACLQKIKNGTTHNNQNPRLIKKAVAVKPEEAGEEGNINNHICYVCHQSFRSVKSLYGHMRKHPEREWRGVQPPKHYLLNHRRQHPSPSSSPTIHYRLSRDNRDHDHYDDDGYDVDGSMGSGGEDLVESLRGWSAKRKRGQRLIMSSSSDEDEDEDEEEAMQQAVSDLLLLAQLSADDCNDNKEQRGTFDHHRVVSSVDSGYGVLKIKDNNKIDDDNDEDDEREKKKGNVEMKDGNGLGFDNCNSEDMWTVKKDYEGDEDARSSDMDDQMMMMMMMKKKQQKKNKRRRLNELDDAVLEGTTAGGGALKEEPVVMSTAQTYSCLICNKSFDKHQALGGHVASHNKNKNVKESSSASAAAEDSKGEDKLAAAASDEETGESSRELAAAAAGGGGSSEHKCNICNKIFPTGQALGGHKRCHWTGPAEALSSSSQVTTSAGEVTQRAPSPSRRVHDFDLNDTPPEYYQFHGCEAAGPSAAAATIS
ncbi:C2H2 type zinc finger transcription factor family [Citrus sinensis]|uniref:uncharacterized protein LOC102622354 n=1 Tax=Citrus sinensis TaxID=2711 RepID=UPI0003D774AE|nr:uncharacterized protein LOC102622354 [Citrus sinensis]KAH9652638.1 C2H2 type zinc finger transcription factor family [Citrus sinensis]